MKNLNGPNNLIGSDPMQGHRIGHTLLGSIWVSNPTFLEQDWRRGSVQTRLLPGRDKGPGRLYERHFYVPPRTPGMGTPL